MTIVMQLQTKKAGRKNNHCRFSAHGLSLKGKEVLLIDLIPRSISSLAGYETEPGAYYLLTPPPGGVITIKQWIRKAREHYG